MRLTLITLCTLLALDGLSQDKKIAVKLAPLSAMDLFRFPTIQGGVELSLSEKWSWYNEFGLRYRNAEFEYANADTNFIPTKGMKAKTELRYYLRNRYKTNTRLEGFYLGANLFFANDHHNTSAEYYFQGDTSVLRIDNFSVKKKLWNLNVLVGRQQTFGKNFLFEYYIGFGGSYRTIKAVNKEYDGEHDDLVLKRNPIASVRNVAEAEGGKSVVPNLTLGLRLGYRF